MNITSDESLATSKATMDTEAIHVSENTAVTQVGTTRARQEFYFSYPGFPEPSKVTSPMVTSSTIKDIVSTTIPASSEITRTEMESTSTLTPTPRETRTSQEIHSATEPSTVPYKALTSATIEYSWTQVTSSSRRPSPDQSTMSPDISTEVITRLSTSPIKTESTEMTITAQTGSPGATSQGTLTLDTSTTTFMSGTHSTAFQGFSHSEMTTLMSRTPGDVPWPSHPSVEEISSASSLLSSPAMTSLSPVSSTLPDSIHSSSLPVTSLLTSGLVKTTELLGTSSEPETSSPPNLSSTSAEILATTEVTTDTEKLEVTNVVTSGYTHESPSSALADSVTTKATSSVGITYPTGDTNVLAATPAFSDTSSIQTKPTLSLTPGLMETSTSEETTSATETNTVLSSVPTGATPEVSRTEAISSSRTSIPGPAQSTISPDISTGTISWFSTSPVMTESTEITMNTHTSPLGATTQGTSTLDTSSITSLTMTHSTLSQGFSHSQMSTLMKRGPEDVSWMSPPLLEKTSSSSLMSSPATTSPSPVSSTLTDSISSSPLPVTSLLTSGLAKTTDTLHKSLEPVTNSPANLSSISVEILATSEVTTDMEKIHPSSNRAVTDVGTSSSGHESQSSVLADSETSKATSPMGTTYTMGETSVSISTSDFFETSRIQIEPTSSLTSGLRETSSSERISSATERSTVFSEVPSGATTEVSRTEVISSRGISMSGPDQSTMSPDISTEAITRLSTSPIMTESAESAITIQTGSPGGTSQGTLTLDTSTTFWSGTHSTASPGFSHSEMTTLMSRTPGDLSWPSLPSVEEASSVSSALSSPAMTSPSFSSTLPESISSSPHPMTVLLTPGPVKTTDMLGTSSESETSPPPNLSSTSDEILDTSEVTKDTEKIHPSSNTPVINVGTLVYKHLSPSSVLADLVTTKATSPMATTSTLGNTSVSTSTPAFPETMMTKPTSSLTAELREISTSQEISSTTERSASLSGMPTGATTEVSKTETISGTFTLGTSSTASWPGTHSAATQRFPQSVVTTPMSRGPEDMSWPSLPSVGKNSSPSSLVSLSTVASPSPLYSTPSGSSHSSPVPVTSLFTSVMMKTTDMLDASLEPETTSPPSLNITSDGSLATSKATVETEAIQVFENTAASHVETTSAREELYSSSPGFSEPTKVTSPMVTSSSIRDNIVSTTMPVSSGLTKIEIESMSSLTPGLRETRTSQDIISSTETSTVLYKMPSDATPEVSRTEVMSSSRTSIPGPAQSTMSPDISDEVVTRLSTSPIMTESAEITITTQTGSSLATSQVTLPLGTSTTFLSGTHTTVSQGLSHSEMTNLMSRGPENLSWTSPRFVETTRSSSSLTSLPLATSLSPVFSTLLESSPSSPLPVTSLILPGLVKTTEVLDTSSEPKTSSSPNLSSTSVEIPATSEIITDTEKIHPTSNTAVTKVGTSSSVHESHSSVLADSETTRTTPSMGITSPVEDTTVFTSIPAFSETRRIPTEPTFSLTPGFRETSTSEETSSITETSAVLFGVPTSATTEVSVTEIMSSNRTHIPDPDQSTMSPDIITEVITRLSSSSMMSESTEMTITTQTSSPGATTQSTLTLATTTAPLAKTHSTVPPRFLHSEMTTLMSRSPENPSWKSSPFVEKTSSSSSLLSLPVTTSPSVSSTLPQSIPSSSFPVTSFLTPGMVKTTDISTEPGTSLSPNLSSTSVEIPAASEVTTDTEKIHPSSSMAVTNVGTTNSGHELYSSVSIHLEPSKATYPVGTSSSMAETTISTSTPANIETTRFEAEPFSHLTSAFRKTNTSLDTSSVTPTNTPSSPGSAHLLQSSKTDFTSSVKTSSPDRPPASQYTEIPVDIITPFNASPSIMESTGVTSFPESKFTMSVTESTHHLSTDLLPSAETISTGTVMPSLSEAVTSFATTGVPRVISGSGSPFSRTESGPGDATLSTIAESLPSSTPVPFSSSTFTTTDSSTIPALHGITSSSATPHRVDTSLGTESSTTEGHFIMVSTLDTSSQPARTSSSPILDTRMTESAELGTVTSAYQVPSLSTRLTRTDGIMEHITKIPSEAAHRGTIRPVKGPQTSTLPVSPKGLHTGGTKRMETTTTAPKTTSRAILITSVYTSTLGTLTPLNASVQMASTSTTEMTITTPYVSPDVPEMTSSLATSLGAETRTALPRTTPSIFNRESKTTASLVPSSEAETSPAIQTLDVSSSEPDTTASWVIHPAETIPTVSKTTPSFSHSESHTVSSTATSHGAEVSSAIPTNISPSEPDALTPLVTISGTDASTTFPTLTKSPHETQTRTTWLTHPAETSSTTPRTIPNFSHRESDATPSVATSPGAETSSAIPTMTVSPGAADLVTSQVTSSGTDRNMTIPTLTLSSGEPKTTGSLVTHPEAQTSSAIPTSTISPGVSRMVTSMVTSLAAETSTTNPALTSSPGEPATTDSLVMHPAQTSPTVPWTTSIFFYSKSDTIPSIATSHGAQSSSAVPTPTVSPGVPGVVTPLGTSSMTVTGTTTPILTLSAGEPETTPSMATSREAEASSAVPTVSPGVLEVVTPLVTSSRAVTGTTIPILTLSPGEPETTPSTATSHRVEGAEASSAVPTPTVSPGVPGVVTPLVTSSRAVISTTISTLTLSPGEPETTPSMATSHRTERAEASSTVPTVLPGVPGVVTSLVTSSSAVASTTIPTLAISSSEPETTTSLVTHSEAKTISAIPTLAVSPTEQGLVTSLVPSSGSETSAFPNLTVVSGQPETTASWITHFGTETNSVVPTLTVSTGEPFTKISFVTHPAESSSTVPRTTSSFSHSESDTMPSTVTSPEAESSSAISTTISPGIPGVLTSLVTSSGTDISATFPTVPESPHESEATASWVTHPAVTSTTVPRTTPNFSHSEPDTTPSIATSPGAEASSAFPTITASSDVPDMVTSQVTSSGTDTGITIPALTLSPDEQETTTSFITYSETHTSSAIPTLTVSPGASKMLTSLVTSSGTDSTTTFRTLTETPYEPETTATQHIHPAETNTMVSRTTPKFSHSESDTTLPVAITSPGPEASSAVSTTTISPDMSDLVTSLVPSSGTDTSTTFPTLSETPYEPVTTATWLTHPAETSTKVSRTIPNFSHRGSDSTPSMVTSPGVDARSAVPVTTIPSSIPEVVTSQVTSSATDTSTAIPTLTPSLGEPETTASLAAHPGTQTGFTVPIRTVPSSEPGTTASWVTHPAQVSTPVLRTTPSFSHSRPDATPLMATSPGTEVSSAVLTTISPGAPEMVTSQITSSGAATSTTIPTLTHSPVMPETTALLITHPSTETSTTFPASTVFPQVSGTTASLSIRPGTETSTALSTQTTSSLFTLLVTGTGRVDLNPTASPGVSAKTASLSTYPGTETSTMIPTSTLSLGLLETTGSLATSSSVETSTGTLTLTVSPAVSGLPSASITTGKPQTVTSWNTKTSPSVTSAGPPEFSGTVTGTPMTLIPSETPTPPKPSHREGVSPTTILRTTVVETTNLAATGSSPTVAKTTTTFNTLAGSSFAPLTTPGMSTLVSESVTSRASKNNFFIVYTKDMGRMGSEIFNATERALQQLLEPLFQNSSIGSLYAGCRLTSLSVLGAQQIQYPFLTPYNPAASLAEKDGTSTRVDAICTYRSDPTSYELDREQLYWELSQLTHGVTLLGPYTLNRNSLYVNGYNHRYQTPATSTPVTSTFSPGISTSSIPSSTAVTVPFMVPFTLNFTITNLQYVEDMRHPGSRKFNATERVLQGLLKPLFRNSSLEYLYSGCRLASLRPEKDGSATAVDAICTHRPDPEGLGLDRERLYWELSNLTNGIQELGPYTLDRNSLYVNGFTHRSSMSATSTPGTSTVDVGTSGTLSSSPSPTTAGPLLVPFTLNFTITNLQYEEDMRRPGSRKFNTTERVLQGLVSVLPSTLCLAHDTQFPLHHPCRLTLPRPEKDGAATGVDAICTHRLDPKSPGLNREQLYWELSKLTNGIDELGPYTLDRNSLYVNGFTHRSSVSTTSTPGTSIVDFGTSGTPSSLSSPTIIGPLLVPFTLNFTITNLQYEEDMHHPGSRKFNTTERVLQGLLGPVFKNTSVGPVYSGCRLTSLRSEKDGAATGVDAICTHHLDPKSPGLNREQLYWELSQLTNGIKELGPYTLDSNSLYVNGFTHRTSVSTTSTPGTSTVAFGTSGTPSFLPSPTAAGPLLVPFTLNFTITNLKYEEDMRHPGSRKFNTTERVLQNLLGPMFKNTSVGPLYSGCRLTLLRSEKDGAATGVDAICTHRLDPKSPGVDREQLYWELSHLTRGIKELGSYTLDMNRLYVNGFTHRTSVPTTSTPGTSTVDLGTSETPYSLTSPTSKHQPMVSVSEKDGAATGVDALCTHRLDPRSPGVDREQLYWELSHLTHGIKELGPYTLDRNSLYVNGFTYRTSVPTTSTPGTSTVDLGTSGTPSSVPSPTTAGPLLVPFTLNFTITNLKYEEDMHHPGSRKFNTTERVLQSLLGSMFKNTSVGPLYSGCRLTLLRSEKDGAATGVDAICTHRLDPKSPGVDREQLYWELSQLTHGIKELGPYTLDRNSLYVNGFTYRTSVPTTNTPGTSTVDLGTSGTPSYVPSPTTAGPLLVPFTLNFTITNLKYEEDMRRPGSRKFNTTERVLQSLLGPMFKNTSVGPLYSGCRLTLLRSEKDGAATGVDAICTHHLDPKSPGVDREQLYWELSQLTHGIKELGPYTLDRNSLYVNGFTHRTSVPTTNTPGTSTVELGTLGTPSSLPSPTSAGPLLVPFTLNFTITNLQYEEDMHHPGSRKFNTTERVLQGLLGPVFNNTSVGPLYSGCRLTLLRPEKNGAATGVDAICTHRLDPKSPGLNREQLYWELSQLTHGIKELGPYTLDRNSLYVNGFTHWSSVAPTTPGTSTVELGTSGTPSFLLSPTAAVPLLVPFTLNFTITNLQYGEDMHHPGSRKFNTTERVLQGLLGPLFKNSSVSPLYSGCRLISLRSEKDGAATGVDAICTHRLTPQSPGLDREQLYWELSQMTNGIKELGPYTLDRNSLYVNGFTYRSSVPTTSTPWTSTVDLGISGTPSPVPSPTTAGPLLVPFTLNFTITNLQYEEDMHRPGSRKFNTTERVLQGLLSPIFKNSSVGPLYSGCRLTSLRTEKDGAATGVDAVCLYHPDPKRPGLDREQLYWELSQLTHSITELGPYTLDRDSLYVNGFTHRKSVPTTSTPGTPTVYLATSGTPSSLSSHTAAGPLLIPFTLNFTITNLHYEENMQHPGSRKFNTTERVLQGLLKPLFKSTSVGPLYSGCRLTLLRPEKDGTATGVDAICTHRFDPTSPGLDRERLYWELSQLTNSITELGPYTLDRDSLYVNGFTHQSSVPTRIPGTSAVHLETSGTPASLPGHTVPGPLLLPFSLNFTITNLQYEEAMRHPGSRKFNTTERVLQGLLGPLFKNTSISPLYSSCRLTLLRPEKDKAATRVDAICTYRPDPQSPGLDREQLYWELSQLTHGITELGPYTLDRDSLYVNGFTHWSSIPTTNTPGTSTVNLGTSGILSSLPETTATSPLLVPFTLNFTITNLQYEENMGHPGSRKFNTTERVLQGLLKHLFKSTDVGPLYSGCRLTLLRPEKDGAATRVDAICTHRPDPKIPGLDRERLYWELSQLTHSITELGPYTLDRDSLYVNGFTQRSSVSVTSTPGTFTVQLETSETPSSLPGPTGTGPLLLPFTLNFTINNLRYKEDMGRPGSRNFNTTERVLQGLLRPLFKNTSVGALYSGCRLTLLRPEKDGAATRVDAVCTHRPDPQSPGLDREQLYWKLSQLTHGITELGPYTLDRHSLYVNGFTHQSSMMTTRTPDTSTMHLGTSRTPASLSGPTTASPLLVLFTLNFTITNLWYEESMHHPGSGKFNTTERVLQGLLRPLFKNTSVGPLYSGCRLTLLRPKKDGAATKVDAICAYRPDPKSPGLDREQLYWELSQLTHGITELGPYTLDRDSLYVNGFTQWSSVPTTSTPGTSTVDLGTSGTPASKPGPSAASPLLVPFTLNFTITNLRYEENMQHRGSRKFNTTERVLQGLLRPLFKSTSVGPLYSGCRLTLLRPEKDGAATGVDAICTHHPDPKSPRLDREQLYWELSQLTHSITELGPYTLDNDSLFVNGFTHRSSVPTTSTPGIPTVYLGASRTPTSLLGPSAASHLLILFTLNFTITNLQYEENMWPGSRKFNTTERVLQGLLRPLFKNTSVGPLYSGCRLTLLRPEKVGEATGVDVICTHRPDPTGPGLDREQLYLELSQLTHSITELGPYTLDRDSLYVNGFTHRSSVPTTSTGVVSEEPFTLNFTINNLRYMADMGQPGSLKFNITDNVMQHLVRGLPPSAALGARFWGFNTIRVHLSLLRSVKNGAKTQVDILCTYLQPLSGPALPIKQVFHELSQQTHGITRLGPYFLDKDSLYLNGYNEPGPDEPPTTPKPATTFLPPLSEATTAMGYHLKTLTLNFTISNLQYSPDMGNGSAAFNSTERVLKHLLRALFQRSSMGPFYLGCRLISLRPEKNGAATGVDTTCTYHTDPVGPGLDIQQLYWELSQLTHGVTQLGFYVLDRDSLFINGYAPQNLSIRGKYQIHFHIVNWNLSNPDPTSSEYIALLRDIQDKVTTLYKGSQLHDTFRYCLVTNLTKRVGQVDGWMDAKMEPSVYQPTKPTSSSSTQHFYLNFTITNLPYSQDISQPSTTNYQRNKRNIEDALNQLFRNSSIKSYFSDCQVSTFRSVPNSHHTGVDSLCNFSPLARRVDRVAIYEEFLRMTRNGSQLQNFTLDRSSVLVDGYSPNRNEPLTGNSDLPFWAIILICLAVLLGLITCLICGFLATTRWRKKEEYSFRQQCPGYYQSHLDLEDLQ
ncbi:PREDICTED: mucin-16 [Mandrillus leucophaeus]|uniref:mucin-16 n=1 Tax=Mandrillus leucophaeus TaxID=9568 RepID=UPI0005F43D52|nr:PREDICTED: mucin-16 [Mandrillus leucophaeus]